MTMYSYIHAARDRISDAKYDYLHAARVGLQDDKYDYFHEVRDRLEQTCSVISKQNSVIRAQRPRKVNSCANKCREKAEIPAHWWE